MLEAAERVTGRLDVAGNREHSTSSRLWGRSVMERANSGLRMKVKEQPVSQSRTKAFGPSVFTSLMRKFRLAGLPPVVACTPYVKREDLHGSILGKS
jgi:hypothetical protein